MLLALQVSGSIPGLSGKMMAITYADICLGDSARPILAQVVPIRHLVQYEPKEDQAGRWCGRALPISALDYSQTRPNSMCSSCVEHRNNLDVQENW